MKILIISKNIGRTAPGIVIEKLVNGLSKFHNIDLLTSDYDPSFTLSTIKNVYEIKEKPIHPRIFKFIVSLFGFYPFDWWWARKGLELVQTKESGKYDLIFSILSLHHYTPLIAGVYIKKKLSAKFAVHTLDAIPAPIAWPENKFYFQRVKNMMWKYLPECDLISSTNEEMLKYQLSTFLPKKGLLTEIIYNPTHGEMESYPYCPTNKNVFIFTGGLYGLRKSKYILPAFKEVLLKYPNSTLEFFGSYISKKDLDVFTFEEQKKVIIHPFTRDLNEYYKQSIALIDIDADLPNDVFISSKIVNYLTINRIIISETSVNSPSRRIFKGIPSIFQCNHDINELATAMKKAIELKNNIDFRDREKTLLLFSINSAVEKLNHKFRLLEP